MTKSQLIGALPALLLFSCAPKPDATVFGNLKFGMTPKELSATGFTCDAINKECKPGSSLCKADSTLFDKPVTPTLHLVGGKLASYDVTTESYSDDDLIGMFTTKFGGPSTCRFTNILGATIEKAYWAGADKSTVTVSKILDHGVAPDLSSNFITSATYRSAAESAAFSKGTC